MHRWGSGAIAEMMMYFTFASVQMIFTLGFGLDPRWVGWALFVPRFFDAIIDPFLGHLSDNTHTRWGRRRPFILGSAILGAATMVGIWWVNPAWGKSLADLGPHVPHWMAGWWATRDWEQTVMFVWMAAGGILIFTFYGVFGMNVAALGYELSDDYNIRAKVQAIRAFYYGAAGVGGSYILKLASDTQLFANKVEGIRVISVVMAALVLVFTIPILTCRERFASANRKHVNVWRAIYTTMRVRPFVMFVVLRFTQTLGTTLFGLVSGYIVIFSICRGDDHQAFSLNPWSAWSGFAMSFILMFLAAPLCRLIGKRWSIVLGAGVGVVNALVMPFLAIPGHPYLWLAQGLFFMVLGSILGVPGAAIMPDICDLDELKSGERREALFSAVMSFVAKLENSVISLVSGYLLYFIGFDQHAKEQPQDVLDKLRMYGFGTLLVFATLGFVISWFIPITEELMTKVRAELEVRRRARAAETMVEPG